MAKKYLGVVDDTYMNVVRSEKMHVDDLKMLFL